MLRKIISIGLMISVYAVFAFGQDDATRITFKRGASSATVRGTVAKGGPDFYVVRAGEGQTMTVSVTGSVSFGIDSPDEESMTDDDGNKYWSDELPDDGDYRIRVYSFG